MEKREKWFGVVVELSTLSFSMQGHSIIPRTLEQGDAGVETEPDPRPEDEGLVHGRSIPVLGTL